ncbi:hypothetical protein HDV05_007765 [Chytridiales sp. JEL 0842]|nr:hypothetical protein HDV05_007765 [Chytridiales sp. JEL 0842]
MLLRSCSPAGIDAVHWSADNQVAIVTTAGLHILTPSCHVPGYEKPIISRTTVQITNQTRENHQPVDRNQTVGVYEGDLSTGCMVAQWVLKGVRKSCIIATITTNYNVLLFEPTDDPINSEWLLLQDITSTLCTYYKKYRDSKVETTGELDDTNAFHALAWLSGDTVTETQNFAKTYLLLGAKDASLTIMATSDGSVYVYALTADASIDENESGLKSDLVCELFDADDLVVTLMKIWPEINLDGQGPPKLVLVKGRRLIVVQFTADEWDVVEVELSLSMSIGGLTLGSDGDEIRMYTLDGKCLIAGILPSGEITVVEESFMKQFPEVLQEANDELAGKDKTEKESDSPAHLNERLFCYGAAVSGNGVFDALVYTIRAEASMKYYTEKQKAAYVVFRRNVLKGDDDFDQATIERLKRLSELPDLLLRYSPRYLLDDLVEYVDPSQPLDNRTEEFIKSLLNALTGDIDTAFTALQSPKLSLSKF